MLEGIVAITSSRHCLTSEVVKGSVNTITCVFYCKNGLKHSDYKFLEICKLGAHSSVFLSCLLFLHVGASPTALQVLG